MIYKHLSVPLRKGVDGLFATVSNREAVQENLRAIVFQEPYERLFRVDIGLPLNSIVWDPADPVFDSMLRFYIRDRVRKFEPRVQLTDVSVSRTENNEGAMVVFAYLHYRLLGERKVNVLRIGAEFERQAA